MKFMYTLEIVYQYTFTNIYRTTVTDYEYLY